MKLALCAHKDYFVSSTLGQEERRYQKGAVHAADVRTKTFANEETLHQVVETGWPWAVD